MKRRKLIDVYVILEAQAKNLLEFRIIRFVAPAYRPGCMDYPLGDGMQLRISRLPEPPGLDPFLEKSGANGKINSFHSAIEGFSGGLKFISAVYSFVAPEHKFESIKFQQAIYAEKDLLKLLNIEVAFSTIEQGLGQHLNETEKRILGYFK